MPEPTGTTPAITTEAEAAALERQLAAYRARQAEAASAERDARMQPLRDLVDTPAYDALVEGLRAIVRAGTFVDDQGVDIHLRGAVQILPNLKAAAA